MTLRQARKSIFNVGGTPPCLQSLRLFRHPPSGATAPQRPAGIGKIDSIRRVHTPAIYGRVVIFRVRHYDKGHKLQKLKRKPMDAKLPLTDILESANLMEE